MVLPARAARGLHASTSQRPQPCARLAHARVPHGPSRFAKGCSRSMPVIRAAAVVQPQQLHALATGRFPGDAFPGASPFQMMDRMDRQMDAQFDQMQREMDRMGSSMFSFGNMRRFEREMDAYMQRSSDDMARFTRQLDSDMARSMHELQHSQPGVRIERQEQRGPGTYRYYESIQINPGLAIATYTPAVHSTPTLASPMLVLAVLLAGLYACVSAAFHKNFHLTLYSPSSKWRLTALWPVLASFSRRFREQFVSALRGVRVKASGDEVQQQ